MGGWNPWETLKARDDIEFDVGPVPDGRRAITVPYPGQPVIGMRPGLDKAERKRTIAHELVHLERGTLCVATDRHILVREEAAVEDEVAERLIPPGELRVWWVRAERDGVHVHPHEVAEHWQVPEDLAERAMRRLLARLP